MNKNCFGFKTLYVVLIFILCCCMAACNGPNAAQPTQENQIATTPNTLFVVNENVGGYEFETDELYCQVVVNGGYKYSCFVSRSNEHRIELYASPTEMIIVDTFKGTSSYYRETFEDDGQLYLNPMAPIIAGFNELDFQHVGAAEVDGVEYDTYCASQTIQKEIAAEVNYNAYTASINWTDGQVYVFQYYDYADGAAFVNGTVPDEINPSSNNSQWVVDMNIPAAVNQTTNEQIPITVVSISVGKGLSPNGGEPAIIEETHYTYVYFDVATGKMQMFKNIQDTDGATVNVLHEVNIQPPEITADMTVMDSDTLEAAIMLLSMLEALF